VQHLSPNTIFDVTTSAGMKGLEADLNRHLGGQVRGLSLEFREAGVVVHGEARTYYAKQLAQHAVMKKTGLPILANEILVSRTS
jgi:hypothetical protein